MVSYAVYRVHMDSWSRRYDVNDDVIKTKQNTSLLSTEDAQEIIYAESNGHVTDDDHDTVWRHSADIMYSCSLHIASKYLIIYRQHDCTPFPVTFTATFVVPAQCKVIFGYLCRSFYFLTYLFTCLVTYLPVYTGV